MGAPVHHGHGGCGCPACGTAAKAAPDYGAHRESPLPRPGPTGGERIPRGNPRPGIPRFLKPVVGDPRQVARLMRARIDAEEPKLQRILYSTLNASREAIKYQEIRNALVRGSLDVDTLQRLQADYNRMVLERIAPVWTRLAESGQMAASPVAGARGRALPFRELGERTRRWVEQRGMELAVNLTEDARAATRFLVGRFAVDTPVGAQSLARLLRASIGLTPRQQQAVARYMGALLKDGAGSGAPMQQKQAERATLNYAGFLHRHRALTIARTEVAFAYNHGQLDAVRTALGDGLSPEPVWKQVLTADDERVCPFCGPLDGQVVGMDDTFPGATLRLPNVLMPPFHPRCRCTVLWVEEPPARRRARHLSQAAGRVATRVADDATAAIGSGAAADPAQSVVRAVADELQALTRAAARHTATGRTLADAMNTVIGDAVDGLLARRAAAPLQWAAAQMADGKVLPPGVRHRLNGALDWASRIFPPEAVRAMHNARLEVLVSPSLRRAAADASLDRRTFKLELGTNTRREVILHELAHVAEILAPHVNRALIDFRRSRRSGDIRPLNELIGPGHGSDEFGVAGRFPDPYMGRMYPDPLHGTELLSMGVQYLTTPRERAKLAADPEFAALLLAALRGRLAPQSTGP